MANKAKESCANYTANDVKNVLDKVIMEAPEIFITPHNWQYSRVDFDGIGASIGIGLICKKKKKKCHIIIGDDINSLHPDIKKIIKNNEDNFDFIESSTAKELISKMKEKPVLVAVDANKTSVLSEGTRELIPNFKDIVVIDHHNTDDYTFDTNYLFTDHEHLSSACEVITNLLSLYNIKLNEIEANTMLVGIYLDTAGFERNLTENALEAMKYLKSMGATTDEVTQMYSCDPEVLKKVLTITSKFETIANQYAISYEPKGIYSTEEIALSADKLLQCKIAASFAFAHVAKDVVSISARSRGTIDVSTIMKHFNGGGNIYSGGARVEGKTVEEVKEELCNLLNPTYTLSIYQKVRQGIDKILNSKVLKEEEKLRLIEELLNVETKQDTNTLQRSLKK